MCPRLYLITPSFCSLPAASVTPSRRTPSMLAMSSWVMLNWLLGSRSSDSSSQRQSCWSIGVMAVAHRGLSHLGDQRLGVAEHQLQHLAMPIELVLQLLSGQSVGMPSAFAQWRGSECFPHP